MMEKEIQKKKFHFHRKILLQSLRISGKNWEELMKTSLYLFFLFSVSFCLFANDDSLNKKENEAISRGNEIISALEQYFLAKSEYPDTLDKLVPNFIDKIPRTGLNNGLKFNVPFYYRCHRNKHRQTYLLFFRYDMFSELYYESDVKMWEYANH